MISNNIGVCFGEVLDYLRQRGPDQLMEEFLSRIHFRHSSLSSMVRHGAASKKCRKELFLQNGKMHWRNRLVGCAIPVAPLISLDLPVFKGLEAEELMIPS